MRFTPELVPKFLRHHHRGEGFQTWRTNFLNSMALLTAGLNRNQAENVILSALRIASTDATFNDIVKFSATAEVALNRLEAMFGLSREQRELKFWQSVSAFNVRPGETLKELCMRIIGLLQNANELGIALPVSQFRHLVKKVMPLHTLDHVNNRVAAMENMDPAIPIIEEIADRYGDYVFRSKNTRPPVSSSKVDSPGSKDRRKTKNPPRNRRRRYPQCICAITTTMYYLTTW